MTTSIVSILEFCNNIDSLTGLDNKSPNEETVYNAISFGFCKTTKLMYVLS